MTDDDQAGAQAPATEPVAATSPTATKRRYVRKPRKTRSWAAKGKRLVEEALPPSPAPEASVEAVSTASTGTRAEEYHEERRRRDFSSTRKRLRCNEKMLDETRFKYHWINDEPGRIRELTVDDDWQLINDSQVAERTLVGSHPDGKPKYAHLARKRKDWWLEDRAKREEELNKADDELRRGITKDAAFAADPSAYVPDGRKEAVSTRVDTGSGDQFRRSRSYQP